LRVTVRGRVQGVGYRDFVRRAAGRLHVTGWVRNRSDGAVEAQICGGLAEVQAVVEEMRSGPPWAEVTDIDVRDDETNDPGHFRILPTS